MRVRAIRKMFDNVIMRQPGDEFDLPDSTNLDPESDPFVVIQKKAEVKAAPEPERYREPEVHVSTHKGKGRSGRE